MSELISISTRESESIAKLSAKAQEDSRTVKILTIIASLYLPAALVASIFNSSLIESVATGDSGEVHFEIAEQFWMFPLFTVVLMIITIILAALWLWKPSIRAIMRNF
jgi:hypothetical protein